MEWLLEYPEFPESVVAQGVAALLEAVVLPDVSALATYADDIAQLPDSFTFSVPLTQSDLSGNRPHLPEAQSLSPEPLSPEPLSPEPLSKVSVAQSVIDSGLMALAALKRLEDRTAACKARLVAKIAAAAQLEAASQALDTWQRSQSGISITAQIAVTLCVPERTAGIIQRTAVELVENQQRTLCALDVGALSWRHAGIIVDELATLAQTPGICSDVLLRFEETLLRHAPRTTASGFASKARRLREGHHPQTLQTRTRQAIAKREMTLEPSKDGMSWLTLHLPAVAAQGVWVQCTRMARAQQQQDGEHRTLTQLRVDTATAVLLGQRELVPELERSQEHGQEPEPPSQSTTQGSPGWSAPAAHGAGEVAGIRPFDANERDARLPATVPAAGLDLAPWDHGFVPRNGLRDGLQDGLVDGIEEDPVGEYLAMLKASRDGKAIAEPPSPSAQVIVTVPVMGLLGLTDELAELTGHGPIPVSMAQRLLGESNSFLRVLTDPITGVPLDLQPERYRVGPKERTLLAAISQCCSWPNCSVPAILSEMDHVEAFGVGGKTTSRNLQPLCKRHHLLKHFKDDKDRRGVPRRINEPERNGIRLRGWSAKRAPDGVIVWTSPSGNEHRPPPRVNRAPQYPKKLAKEWGAGSFSAAEAFAGPGWLSGAAHASVSGAKESIFERYLLEFEPRWHSSG